MSTLKTNNIQHVDRSDPSIIINTDGSVNIAGTMTYEDVTSVDCLLYTSPSPRDCDRSRMPSSA